jgi:penicillin-binding protein 2
MSIVKDGMHSVTSEGTASAYFADYPISVGGKTGTAQTTGYDNSVLTVFAPFDDPQIAVSIVIEHGQKSYSTGPVAKAILDEYFFGSADIYDEKLPNTLID